MNTEPVKPHKPTCGDCEQCSNPDRDGWAWCKVSRPKHAAPPGGPIDPTWDAEGCPYFKLAAHRAQSRLPLEAI